MGSKAYNYFRRVINSPAFTKHLLWINVGSGILLDSFGDVLTQTLVEHTENYDWKRSLRMGTIGLLFAPPYHYWYIYLDKWYPSNTAKHMRRKLGLDLLIAGPIAIAIFYIAMNKLQGRSLQDGCFEVQKKFWPTFKADLMLWVPVQTINFYFLPLSLRLISVNTVCLFWAMYLSYIKHNDIKSPNTSPSISSSDSLH